MCLGLWTVFLKHRMNSTTTTTKTKTKTEEKAERYEWLRMNWEREVEKLSVLLAGTGWVRPTVNPYLAKTDCCVSGTMDCVSQQHTHTE